MSLYRASVPVFLHMLASLDAIVDRAEGEGADTGAEPLLDARLHPDMYPLTRQIQLASDFAKGAGARLAGIGPPRFEDTERSFADLKNRIERTVSFLKSLDAAQIDAALDREITIKILERLVTFEAAAYLHHFALPQFFFHVTTAYNILRHHNLPLGKRDYIGRLHTR